MTPVNSNTEMSLNEGRCSVPGAEWGNWLRWWAMMPLALSDGKSSEGCATADEGLGGGLAVRRVDWATQRFPWPSHGRDPQA